MVEQLWMVGASVVAVVVWLVRLEGRVNATEAFHRQIADDIRYLRERIDSAMSRRV